MRVGDLRKRVTLLERNGDDDQELARLIYALLEKLDAPDDMSIQELILKLVGRSGTAKPEKPPIATPSANIDSIVATLNAAFQSDDAFAASLDAVRKQRAATKAVLTQVFYKLFKRNRGVPKTATRDELLRLIADERHILVRNAKMGNMIGRKIVPAE